MSAEDVLARVDTAVGIVHVTSIRGKNRTACGLEWAWVTWQDGLDRRVATDGRLVNGGILVAFHGDVCARCGESEP